jgi:hypothetical protein
MIPGIVIVVLFLAICVYYARKPGSGPRPLPPDRPRRATDIAIYPILEGIMKSSIGQETLSYFAARNFDVEALKLADYRVWSILNTYSNSGFEKGSQWVIDQIVDFGSPLAATNLREIASSSPHDRCFARSASA